jgi:hypothetical protein
MVKKGVHEPTMPPKSLQIRNSTVEFSVSKDSLVTAIKEIKEDSTAEDSSVVAVNE